MAIPFRYDDEFKQMGLAAYLKIEPAAAGYRGALFLINGRGEPVEFTYTHIEIPQAFLWREADIRLHAARRITTALFSLCPRTPTLILCLAAEIDSRLFCHDVSVTIPVCRIAPAAVSVSREPGEHRDETNMSEPMQLLWFPSCPTGDSNELRLFQRLLKTGLLAEPFTRAATGLREVYK
jgi:hypothetical protein